MVSPLTDLKNKPCFSVLWQFAWAASKFFERNILAPEDRTSLIFGLGSYIHDLGLSTVQRFPGPVETAGCPESCELQKYTTGRLRRIRSFLFISTLRKWAQARGLRV